MPEYHPPKTGEYPNFQNGVMVLQKIFEGSLTVASISAENYALIFVLGH